MSRTETTLCKESALYLLARSIAFGHERLAVVRLAIAVQAGADVPRQHWAFCQMAANRDLTLQALLRRAAAAAALAAGHATL